MPAPLSSRVVPIHGNQRQRARAHLLLLTMHESCQSGQPAALHAARSDAVRTMPVPALLFSPLLSIQRHLEAPRVASQCLQLGREGCPRLVLHALASAQMHMLLLLQARSIRQLLTGMQLEGCSGPHPYMSERQQASESTCALHA